MAVYSTRTVTSTRREWSVPVNINHAEFIKAYDAATSGYQEAYGLDRDATLSADALWITSDGNEITISFTVEASQ